MTKDQKIVNEAYSITFRWKEIRKIIIKRKSAFTIYEWMMIKEFMNCNKAFNKTDK